MYWHFGLGAGNARALHLGFDRTLAMAGKRGYETPVGGGPVRSRPVDADRLSGRSIVYHRGARVDRKILVPGIREGHSHQNGHSHFEETGDQSHYGLTFPSDDWP